ncbi:unnamed protein product [Lathyrus sativus]|nr:unnamed protein product [Lathyrus sativus]
MEPFIFAASTPPLSVKPLDGCASRPPRSSFWDILTKGKGATYMKERVYLIKKGLMIVSLEGGNKLLPKVTINEKLFQELYNLRKEALFIKLIEKNMGYHLMKDRLKNM